MTYRNKRIERTVFKFLSSLPSHMPEYPFNVEGAIRTLDNCAMHSYQYIATKNKVTLNEVIDLCQSETGCTHQQHDKYIIMYNSNSIRARINFTIAHELGHILLNHFDLVSGNKIAEGVLSCEGTKMDIIEREANYFAACLLCPIPVIYKMKPNSISKIQRFFEISNEASAIAWKEYQSYDRNYHIMWHNDMLKMFQFN